MNEHDVPIKVNGVLTAAVGTFALVGSGVNSRKLILINPK
jgi:hypothetical protein